MAFRSLLANRLWEGPGHDDPATLLRAKALYTIVGGRIVHEGASDAE